MRKEEIIIGRPLAGIVFVISLFLLFPALNTARDTQTLQSKVDEYINRKMEKFSGSILIARKGKVLVSKGYGMANFEHDIPNTPQTKFRIGSVTKQFTATAIMQLQEKGLLNVDDPLKKYIEDYPNGEKITLHHLLTHTSGIVNVSSIPEHRMNLMFPTPVEKTILLFKDKPLEFPPGEKFKYCNSGYHLLGYIIEKVTGKSYEEFLEENIFQPLNMMNSGFDRNRTILKNRASGYAHDDNNVLINAPYINAPVTFSAGGLYSTVEDMYIWDRALYTEKILKKSSFDKMFTPFKGNYGYGWRIDKILNHECIHHAGGHYGFQANIARYVDDDVCVIILSNMVPIRTRILLKDLTALVFGEKDEQLED